MSKYSNLLAKSNKNENARDCVDYHVVPMSVLEKEVTSVGLAFSSRDLARQYKKLLKKSLAKLDARIIRREFLDGYVVSESEVY